MILTMLIVLLYIILIMLKRLKVKNLFSYIFNDNINYIRSLYNRTRLEMLLMVIFKKRFFVALSILAMIFLFALIVIRKLLSLTNVILSFVLPVVLKKLRFVLLISLPSLLMLNIVIYPWSFKRIHWWCSKGIRDFSYKWGFNLSWRDVCSSSYCRSY